MLRRIKNLLLKDALFAVRENILVYSLVVPVALALVMRLMLPSLEAMELTFAVDASVPPAMVARLEEYGRVEALPDRVRLEQRVLAFDDVPGIYLDGGRYVVMLEGNEEDYAAELPGVVIDHLAGDPDRVAFTAVSRPTVGSPVRDYALITLVLLNIMIGGMTIGMSVVEDRQSRVLEALAVGPMRFHEYIVAKSALALIVTVGLSLVMSLIVRGAGGLLALAATVTASLPLAVLVGLAIGYLARDQLGAIAVVKVMGLPLGAVPAAAFLLPAGLRWILYPFPNYWAFETLRRLFVDPSLSLGTANLAAAGTGLVALAVLLPMARRRFRL